MKKIIVSAAMLAFGSFTASGASCVSGTLASVIASGACTVGSSDQWTLSNFGLGEVSAFNYGPNNNPTTANINVVFQNAVGDGVIGAAGMQGFHVSFAFSGNGTNFFEAGILGQTAAWQSYFRVDNSSANTIKQVYSLLGDSVSIGNAAVQVNKFVSVTGVSPAIGNVNIINTNGTGPLPSALQAVPFMDTNTATSLSIVDAFQVQSSVNTGVAVAGFYTNSFFAGVPPETGVPEPMTFVLMGAGLVGISALRRRNG